MSIFSNKFDWPKDWPRIDRPLFFLQKEHQKQLLTAFTKTICSYLEINEKTKDMVANAFNQKLLVIEKQMIRLNFVEELSKTSQKIEGQHPSKLASKDLMECSNDAFFL